MTAQDFTAWQKHMGFTDSKTHRALGISRNSVTKYAKEGAPEHIGLACAAIAFGLPAWRSQSQN